IILAGTNVVATDHVGARVMGYDPEGDYPDHPFLYRRNAIKLTAEMGVGPNSPDQIEIIGESPEAVSLPFRIEPYGEGNRSEELRRGAQCVTDYRENQSRLAKQHHGRYLALFDGKVLWDEADMQSVIDREKAIGLDWRSVPQFVIRCVEPEEEIE